ncbi:MAG: hypothetical protein IKR48_07345, partial [Kiritimatiellae bacterium]|nr:hypothetical protein [Kiritimatiellia bacterium]
ACLFFPHVKFTKFAKRLKVTWDVQNNRSAYSPSFAVTATIIWYHCLVTFMEGTIRARASWPAF